MAAYSIIYASLGFLSILAYLRCVPKKSKGNLPPGPRPWPILGNAMDLPPSGVAEYQHWYKHKDLYGPISSISTMGQTLVIIHDKQLALEILNKRSLKTSDRPVTEMLSAFRERATMLPNISYNASSKYIRKLIHLQMGTKQLVKRFREPQDIEAKKLLLKFLENPNDIKQKFQSLSSATILKTTYGYSPKANGPDPLVDHIESFLEKLIETFTPGRWLVDIFPIIKSLPEGCPGTGFLEAVRSLALQWKEIQDIPYDIVQGQIKLGNHAPSFVSQALGDITNNRPRSTLRTNEEEVVKSAAAIMYIGAVETTITALELFTLAMVKFPEVQYKAQEEIDRVVGNYKLPGFQHRQNLPYIQALITELLRWFPVVPMGITHIASEDIITPQGYLIPQGACILPNIHWFTHDPELYPDPDVFDPERFITPRNEPDPRDTIFGFGRRICPGRYFGEESLYINIVRLLAAFKMSKAMDEDGNEIDPVLRPSPGVAMHVNTFPYNIVPRSAKHAELIQTLRGEVEEKDE